MHIIEANCLTDKEIDHNQTRQEIRELLHSIFLELSKQTRLLKEES